MKLIITRHGETEENAAGITQGWLPGHLSEKGKKEAKLLAERLKDVHIDVIYTSDLARVYDTAVEIAKYHDCPLIKEKRIRERNLGEVQGKVWPKDYLEKMPGDIAIKRPKGGETLLELTERLKTFYEELLEKYDTETILVVSHGGSLMMLQGIIQSLTIGDALKIEKQKNSAITEYEINKDGSYRIIVENCEGHLEG